MHFSEISFGQQTYSQQFFGLSVSSFMTIRIEGNNARIITFLEGPRNWKIIKKISVFKAYYVKKSQIYHKTFKWSHKY